MEESKIQNPNDYEQIENIPLAESEYSQPENKQQPSENPYPQLPPNQQSSGEGRLVNPYLNPS